MKLRKKSKKRWAFWLATDPEEYGGFRTYKNSEHGEISGNPRRASPMDMYSFNCSGTRRLAT